MMTGAEPSGTRTLSGNGADDLARAIAGAPLGQLGRDWGDVPLAPGIYLECDEAPPEAVPEAAQDPLARAEALLAAVREQVGQIRQALDGQAAAPGPDPQG